MSEAKKTANSKVRIGRYELVSMARDWITAMKNTDDFKDFGQSELVKEAIAVIRSGKMNAEEIEKALEARKKAAVEQPAEEKKAEPGAAKSDKSEK